MFVLYVVVCILSLFSTILHPNKWHDAKKFLQLGVLVSKYSFVCIYYIAVKDFFYLIYILLFKQPWKSPWFIWEKKVDAPCVLLGNFSRAHLDKCNMIECCNISWNNVSSYIHLSTSFCVCMYTCIFFQPHDKCIVVMLSGPLYF